jgi:hypothetical protein
VPLFGADGDQVDGEGRYKDPSLFESRVAKAVVDVEEAVVDVEEAVVDVEEAVVDVEEAVVDVEEAVVDVEEAVVDVEEAVVDVEEAVVDAEEAVVDVEEAGAAVWRVMAGRVPSAFERPPPSLSPFPCPAVRPSSRGNASPEAP